MSFEWIQEKPPRWDGHKASIVGGAPSGIFDIGAHGEGDVLPGEWWRVEDDAAVIGYGWLDTVWGDAEILLAVAPNARNRGVGTFILDRLEDEAAKRGINYVYNVVRSTHPERARVTRWLEARGFKPSKTGELKRRVKSTARSS